MKSIPVSLFALLSLASLKLPVKADGGALRYVPPRVVLATAPTYPANSVSGGTVVLEVKVSPTGEVEKTKVVEDVPGFTSEAMDAVKNWKFKPAELDGSPIESTVTVAVCFSLPPVWWGPSKK